MIAINKTLRAECERLLPMIERAKEPACEEDILSILVRHAPHYGVQAKSGEEWAALFGAYLDALRGLSAYAIEDGFVRWNRGEGHADLRMAGFYPKSGQLFILATAGRNELATAAYRAKRAMEYVEEKLPRQMTEEERRANTAAIQRLMAEPAKKLPPQPPGVSLKDWAAQCRESGNVESTIPRTYQGPKLSPQQMAERIRASVGAAPGANMVGDVL